MTPTRKKREEIEIFFVVFKVRQKLKLRTEQYKEVIYFVHLKQIKISKSQLFCVCVCAVAFSIVRIPPTTTTTTPTTTIFKIRNFRFRRYIEM